LSSFKSLNLKIKRLINITFKFQVLKQKALKTKTIVRHVIAVSSYLMLLFSNKPKKQWLLALKPLKVSMYLKVSKLYKGNMNCVIKQSKSKMLSLFIATVRLTKSLSKSAGTNRVYSDLKINTFL